MTEISDLCGVARSGVSGRMSMSFNVCSIFILEMLWPGMGVCNLISHSTHGINGLEKVSGKKKIKILVLFHTQNHNQSKRGTHTLDWAVKDLLLLATAANIFRPPAPTGGTELVKGTQISHDFEILMCHFDIGKNLVRTSVSGFPPV